MSIPRPLRPYLGAVRRWIRSMPPRPGLQKQHLLSDPSLTDTERELLGKVSGKIYFNDTMYDGDGAHYYKVGLSAICCIDEAVAQAKLNNVRHDSGLALRQRARAAIFSSKVSRSGNYRV